MTMPWTVKNKELDRDMMVSNLDITPQTRDLERTQIACEHTLYCESYSSRWTKTRQTPT